MENKITSFSFPVSVYGELERYNEVISKGRCRIFYKYENRNGTYITDSFAEELLSSLPYTPVKGIFDAEEQDYTDHGQQRNLGRIYGIVPENPNLSWETHLDEDGVERTYACTDVLIFTALYGEANQIFNKSQSMELYDKSIQGNWQFINGKKYYVFEHGCFLGLQVLGEDVEPCFEGAAFYTFYDKLNSVIEQIQKINSNFQNNEQGGKEMQFIDFKLSDNDKFNAIWSLLNPNYCEEGGWVMSYGLCDVYDEYAIAKDYENNTYVRVYYEKDDATDSVSINKIKKCHIIDITDEEKAQLDAVRQINGGSFEKIDETFAENETLKAEKIESEQKIEELNTSVSTLNTEKESLEAAAAEQAQTIESLNNSIEQYTQSTEALQQQVNELASFKKETELKQKESVINSYKALLSEDVIQEYTSNLDAYTCLELDKELTYALKQNNPSAFSTPAITLIPKDEPKGGLEELLAKYSK